MYSHPHETLQQWGSTDDTITTQVKHISKTYSNSLQHLKDALTYTLRNRKMEEARLEADENDHQWAVTGCRDLVHATCLYWCNPKPRTHSRHIRNLLICFPNITDFSKYCDTAEMWSQWTDQAPPHIITITPDNLTHDDSAWHDHKLSTA